MEQIEKPTTPIIKVKTAFYIILGVASAGTALWFLPILAISLAVGLLAFGLCFPPAAYLLKIWLGITSFTATYMILNSLVNLISKQVI